MAAEPIQTMSYPCLLRGDEMLTAFSLPDQRLHQVDMPELQGNTFAVTPQGWLLIVGNSGSAHLFNPQTNSRVELPALEGVDDLPAQRRCVLSSSDASAPGCGVLVLDLASPAMLFCRVGERRWSKHGYDVGCYDLPKSYCPVPKKRIIFSLAAVNGRFFFLESRTHGELGTLDFTDGPEPEARLGAIPVPSIRDDLLGNRQQMCGTMTHLLESCGDLYLTTVSFYGNCFDVPGTVRVYKMDFSAPAWRKVEDVGDRAFLLGVTNFGASCSASEHGLKPNKLYWMNGFDEEANEIDVYDVKDGGLEVIRTFEHDDESDAPGPVPFWIVPVSS